VNLGVHYPSDCVIGILQGLLVCIIGTFLWKTNSWGCNSCYDAKCYSPIEDAITKDHLSRFSYVALIVCVAVGVLLTFVSSMKPIEIWNKSDRIFGMLLPGITFQVTLLCPKIVHHSLSHPLAVPWYGYLYGIGIAAITTVAGFKNSGRWPVVSFLLIFTVNYVALAVWRLWIMQ